MKQTSWDSLVLRAVDVTAVLVLTAFAFLLGAAGVALLRRW